MRAERRLLRVGEYLIGRACRHLPAEARDERYREWVAELPAILRDPDVRPAARRAARMLRYASGTIRGTALTPGSARRVLAYTANQAAPIIAIGVLDYFQGWTRTPQGWIYSGIGWLIGSLIVSGGELAYRRMRGKGPGDDLTNALMAPAQAQTPTRAQARARAWAQARARARATSILKARAAAEVVNSTAGYTALSFPRRKLVPGYQPAEVDEFIARIEATLSGNAGPGQAVTAADVQAVTFNVTRHGGYHELTMDEVLDHYAHELDKRTPPVPPVPPATAPCD
jgi:DivIVA domain-containing protein